MTLPNSIRWPFAVLLVAHGAVHAIGFLWAFELADVEGLGGPTFLIDGAAAGDSAVVAFGLLWLVSMVAFMAAGIGVARKTPWGTSLAAIAAGISLIATVVWWNDAWRGALISAVILVVVVAIAGPSRDANEARSGAEHVEGIEA